MAPGAFSVTAAVVAALTLAGCLPIGGLPLPAGGGSDQPAVSITCSAQCGPIAIVIGSDGAKVDGAAGQDTAAGTAETAQEPPEAPEPDDKDEALPVAGSTIPRPPGPHTGEDEDAMEPLALPLPEEYDSTKGSAAPPQELTK